MKILIIEDEISLSDIIKERLKKESFQVDTETDGLEGYYKASTNIYDLIILDVMLPKMNGFQILKKLREEKINSKIIMLTARSLIEDKLNGLENGADDYLTKPFHIDELVARIKLRLKLENKDTLTYKDISLNTKTKTLTCIKTNQTVCLVRKEFLLIECFLNNQNQIITKEYLYDRVWGLENEIESNNLEVYLSFIRKKLKATGSKVNIKSARGLGYKMEYKNE